MIRGNKNKTKVSTKENKPKFKRKEKTKIIESTEGAKMPNKFLGGYLPFPPKECLKKEHWALCYGVIWIDLSVCHWCNDLKVCKTRKEHLHKLKEQRQEYFSNKDIGA